MTEHHPLPPDTCDEVLRVCGSFNLRKASRSVTQLYDDYLQPTGLRSTQVVVLVILARERQLSMGRLARELMLSPSTLSRNLRPLERDSLIDITSNAKRGKSVRLTDQGEQALLDAVPHWQRAQAKFTELVGAEQWQELSTRLSETLTALRS